MRSLSLAHGGRRGLHPGGRQAVGVGGHLVASHVGHGGRVAVAAVAAVAVVASVAPRDSVHAVVVPALILT